MEYSSDSPGVVSQWKRKRLDRLLVDHFVRCGFYELAVSLARQSQIEQLTNIDIFLVAKEVSRAGGAQSNLRADTSVTCCNSPEPSERL